MTIPEPTVQYFQSPTWCILELMGHRRLGGLARLAGSGFHGPVSAYEVLPREGAIDPHDEGEDDFPY